MSDLLHLQSQFQAWIQAGEPDVRARIRDSARTDRDTLLGVYRDAYLLRLHECLGIDFKAVQIMLGDDAFFATARDYIGAHPSLHPNVRWFGRHFPDFLRDYAPTADRPALAEMAAFEWALGLATDAADDEALIAEDLAALDGEQWAALVLRKRAPVQRLDLHWQVPQAWLRHAETAPGALDVEHEEAPVQWLVWRDGLDAAFRSLPEDEAWAFDAAMKGASFAELCEGLCRFLPPEEAAARGAGLLRLWIDHKLLRAGSAAV